MLEFCYDFLDYYLPREDYELLETDTDSNYLGITAENVEDLIKLELKNSLNVKSITGLLLHSHPKESVLLDSFKSSLRKTK